MSDVSAEPGVGPQRNPENVFDRLRERPTPDLDSGRLWRRLEPQLEPRSVPLWTRLFGAARRPAGRLVFAAASIAVVAIVVWTGSWLSLQTGSPELVLLTPGEPDVSPLAAVAPTDNGVLLDVRLVRGFDGAVPADVRSAQALGVGGADALQDVRERIETLLPFADYGVVGAWQGAVVDGESMDIPLSDAYDLIARSATYSEDFTIRLQDVELVGDADDTVAGDLILEPGRLYILGVLQPGASNPDLVLLIRARARGEERR